MSILITGGAGFIGSHLAAHFHGRKKIRILDNLRTGHRRNLAGLDVEFIEGSITDRATVHRAMQGVEYVFHLAAQVSVPESMQRPVECAEINVLGLLNVLEEAHATFHTAHATDRSTALIWAMDLTPLVADPHLSIEAFTLGAIDRFRSDVQRRLGQFT